MSTPSPGEIREQLLNTFQPPTVAWSVDGRTVEFLADFELGIEHGGFITITTPRGVELLAQVHDLEVVSRRGMAVQVDIEVMGIEAEGVTETTIDMPVRMIEGRGLILGRTDGGRRSPRSFNEADLAPASDDVIEAYLTEEAGAESRLPIGVMRNTKIPAQLRAKGFARHTFMVGQSGSGKTFSLGVVLERLLNETELPVVIFDPNSDYVNLGRLDSRTAINRFANPQLSKGEYDELAAEYPKRAKVAVASREGGDLPLRIHLSDLTTHEQALTMRIDPIDDPGLYHALRDTTAAFDARVYDVEDLVAALTQRFDDDARRLARRIANLGLSTWDVWARSDEDSLLRILPSLAETRTTRVVVLDTGSLRTTRERSLVALALFGRLQRRPLRRPLSIVVDEAHNVCPPEGATRLDQAVVDIVTWIAGEGRKFGLYVVLSTQRPQKIHRNVLSQCDNLLLMRVNSDTDLAELEQVFSHVPSALIHQARSHRMGEMLAAGPVAPTPLRLQVGSRWTKEGGADLPTDWARRT